MMFINKIKMKIPNYDCQDPITNFKQLHPFMPDRTFRMLICGPSGSGKTNVLLDMIFRLLFYDKIYLYAKNLDQTKYQHLLKTFRPISKEAGYDVVEASPDEIVPVSELTGENQKLVVFDDFITEKNQKPLVDYFIQGRHRNCSVIYLSQSYFGTPKDIRLNCSHFCIFEFPSNKEITAICRENNVSKEAYRKATKQPFSFLYLDKPRKFIAKNFDEKI